MISAPSPTHRGPVGAAERVLAPDLARGFMLLMIALANSVVYLHGHEATVRRHPITESGVDSGVNFLLLIAVDARVYPMFAFLFGYGMVQLLSRQERAGTAPEQARRLLRRRNTALLVFGALHGLLLFSGDILGSYGLAGLLIGWLLIDRSDRMLRHWAAALFAVTVAFYAMNATVLMALERMGKTGALGETGFRTIPSMAAESPGAALLLRLSEWPVATVMAVPTGVIPPMLLGIVAARHRLLEDPQRHARLLATLAGTGVAVALLGGLPLALAGAGGITLSKSEEMWLTALHTACGIAGGIGYAALFGLIGGRLRRRTGPISTALAATGRRALTCYLAQSLLFVPAFTAWTAGLGAELSSAETALFACSGWLVTVAAAVAMDRRGYRGPAEASLRRIVYGPPGG